MIEIFRKGFRLDINPTQVITFKKSQNLNGIQDRYAYSNTISLDKTANNKKLLELFDLPTNKVASLMNGYTVDVVLNGSINLRNQTLKIQKETLEKIDTYLLYSDNALVVKLKEQYINAIVAGFLYKKDINEFFNKSEGVTSRTAFVETQENSGLYVIEEMPILIQLQELLKMVFVSNGYTVYGDFFVADNDVSEYYVAPNKGVYQIYETGLGFAPTFDANLTAFDFLNQTLAFFNCYAEVDDTYRTLVVNKWTNLDGYKSNYVDYSKYFVNYSDYTFQSKLAKRNELTYSNIVYDADGLRKFTAQSLKKLTASQPFTNNAAPKKDKNFGNIKAECAFKLRQLLNNNEVLCLDHEFRKQIVAELESIRLAEPDPEGKIRLEKKSKHKERTGKSPDFFDSLLMRMIFEIKPSGGWG